MSPLRTFCSFMRTCAEPRAILMWVQSRTFISCPSSSMMIPFLTSPVLIIDRSACLVRRSCRRTLRVRLGDVGLLLGQGPREVMGSIALTARAGSHEVVVAGSGVRVGHRRERGKTRSGDG